MITREVEYGDPRLPQRVWDKIYPEPNTGCWLWGAATVSAKGYGSVWFDGRPRLAHRVVYNALIEGIVDLAAPGRDMELDHLCRTPSCVNPEHLELVTKSVNLMRGFWPGMLTTHCPRGHEYTNENTLVRAGHRKRTCRTCNRVRALDRWRKTKRNPHAVPHHLRTHCPSGHEYTDDNTYRSKVNGSRKCRACVLARTKAVYEKNRSQS